MERHVLGISGGRDSASLAILMREQSPEIDMEYFFTDTGKELPEVYDYLVRLEGFLGKPIVRLNPDRDFDFWLRQYNNFLPSVRTRWCTRQLKIRPFEQWIKKDLARGVKIYSYVAIRADEGHREGHSSKHDNLTIKLPLKEQGIDKAGVIQLLEDSGIGTPQYYDWRSRSGCTFCFFQQKIEWVRLKERHPDAYEEAKRYEKKALENSSPFTWSQGESLDQLECPKRIKKIKSDHEKRVKRLKSKQPVNPLRPGQVCDVEEVYSDSGSCVMCHK